jgi:hypothetical protein
MKLNESAKNAIGLGTAWIVIFPFLFIFVCCLMIVIGFTTLNQNESSPFITLFSSFFLPLYCLTFLLQLGLMAFYLTHLYKNEVISETWRIIMGLGIVFMSLVTMPAYYYLYLWLEEPPKWTQSKNRKKIDQVVKSL